MKASLSSASSARCGCGRCGSCGSTTDDVYYVVVGKVRYFAGDLATADALVMRWRYHGYNAYTCRCPHLECPADCKPSS